LGRGSCDRRRIFLDGESAVPANIWADGCASTSEAVTPPFIEDGGVGAAHVAADCFKRISDARPPALILV
jgi:hypothetical protein